MANPFRHVKFDNDRIEASAKNEEAALHLYERLLMLPESRERSRAITKLEETVMWANRALRVEQIKVDEKR